LALVFLAGALILWRTVFYQAKGLEDQGGVGRSGPGHLQQPAALVSGPGQEGPGPISRLTAEVQKYLKIKEIGELSDPEKFMEALRGVLPQESTALETLNRASEKLKESKKLRQEGKTGEADKSSKEGRVEMQKLMAQVADRQYAQDAQIKMMEARLLAQRSGRDEKNLLYRMSGYEERNADEALVKGDFSGARTLYTILESLYRQSLRCDGDKACCGTLQQMAAALEAEVRGLPAGRTDPWMLAYADQIKSQAVAYFGRGEYDNAAASYLQVLFLLQKIKEK